LEQDVKARLTAAQVLLRIAPFCKVDKELGEVPSTRLFPRLTGHQAKVDNWIQTTRGGIRRQGPVVPQGIDTPNYRLETRRLRSRCGFCRQLGHFNMDCPTPHLKCSARRCTLQRRHEHYEPQEACPYFLNQAQTRQRLLTNVKEDMALNDLADEYFNLDDD
jgi:hypothetical protein